MLQKYKRHPSPAELHIVLGLNIFYVREDVSCKLLWNFISAFF